MNTASIDVRVAARAAAVCASAWLASCGGPAKGQPPPEEPVQASVPTEKPGPTDPGSAPCAGKHTGTWLGITVEDMMVLEKSCDFEYLGPDGCWSRGRYEEPFGPSGSVGVIIEEASGEGCLPVGDYECAYTLENEVLTFDCGAGSFSYGRMR